MKKTFTFFIIILFLLSMNAINSLAQNKHALLVGIDTYMKAGAVKDKKQLARPESKDLPGSSLNDVYAISDMLTARFGFGLSDIQLLVNEQATREGILNSLIGLKRICNKGDIVFFYFAGHGSQMKNPGSSEIDKLDETIVPYDGVILGRDIRDKLIASFFQEFVDKGVLLTAVFESCHSGSIARGIDVVEEKLEPSTEVINDSKKYPDPTKNGALIISASQDYQSAYARNYNNVPFSDFTKAFIEVLSRTDNNTCVNDLGNSITVHLKNKGSGQIPSIAGTPQRCKSSLLGINQMNNDFNIAVDTIRHDNTIILDGGMAIGLETGSELTSDEKKIKLEVIRNIGISKSTAKVLQGNAGEIKPGMLFKVTRSAYSPKHKIQVAFPMADLTASEFVSISNAVAKVIAEKKLKLINDPMQNTDYLLYFSLAHAESKWILNSNGTNKELGDKLDMQALSETLIAGKSIQVRLPGYKSLNGKIETAITNMYSGINITDLANSDYFLSGTISNGQVSYALVKTLADTSSGAAYPERSDYFILNEANENEIATNICETAYKLGKIKSWLTLESTDKTNDFPYSLILKKKSGIGIENGIIKDGDTLKFYLSKINGGKSNIPKKRWVYIFDMASDGSIHLLFPWSKQNSENRLPANDTDSGIEELPVSIPVSPPFGTDNLIMLTTDEPLANPSRIEQEGLVTRSIRSNPLEEIVDDMNTKTRGVNSIKAPTGWSIQKITLKTIPK